MGVVTVCVSLLSNEHTVLQEYSCSIIANLLMWECRGRNPNWVEKSVRKFLINLNGHSLTYLLTHSLTYLLTHSLTYSGIKILTSKLTSPNACVKLWNSSGDSNQKLVAGVRTNQTSSQVTYLLTHSLLLTYSLTLLTHSLTYLLVAGDICVQQGGGAGTRQPLRADACRASSGERRHQHQPHFQ